MAVDTCWELPKRERTVAAAVARHGGPRLPLVVVGSKAEGWECGLVELRAGCLLRDDDTQLLAAFDLTREVARPIGVAA